jgi:peptide/nickel transport system permease protein
MLSRLIFGARVAMFIAVVPNALALLLATAVGTTAGYYGGRVDTVLMRLTEVAMTLPTFLLALALLAVLGSGLPVVVAALVLVSWTYPARVIYGETLRIRELAFVEAARALGASAPRIIVRHVVPPPAPSWGVMIAAGRDVLFWPWLMLLPGVCLALLGTGFYLIGAGLQRALGPRLERVRL